MSDPPVYQTIPFSDEEESAPELSTQGKQDVGGLYNTLGTLDFLCSQVNHSNNIEGTNIAQRDSTPDEGIGNILGDIHDSIMATAFYSGEMDTENTVYIDEAKYSCKLCKTVFNVQHLVEEHLMVKHDLAEQTALFRVLKRTKKKKRAWKREKDGYFHCLFCHHRSRRSINVKEHEKQMHAGEKLPEKLYICKLCNDRFALHEIFGHIQSQHESQSDSLTLIGNSLTEHYTVSFSAEKRTIEPEKSTPKNLKAERVQLTKDGFYLCGKCDFSTKDMSNFTEHFKSHSLVSNSPPETYNYCQQCSYKTKSLRGLAVHKKMKHKQSSSKVTKKSVKVSSQGQSLSVLRKGNKLIIKKINLGKAGMENNINQNGKSFKSLDGSENVSESECADGKNGHNEDFDDSTIEDDTGRAEDDWPMDVEGLLDSDTQESIDDSDKDPEWAPTATAASARKKRLGRWSKDRSYSDSDSENEPGKRRRLSTDDSGKRKRGLKYPKDPDSPSPKKLDNGCFKCNFCDFESKYSHSTEMHQWRHTGFKPFKCDKCQKAFRQRPRLDVHLCRPVKGIGKVITDKTKDIAPSKNPQPDQLEVPNMGKNGTGVPGENPVLKQRENIPSDSDKSTPQKQSPPGQVVPSALPSEGTSASSEGGATAEPTPWGGDKDTQCSNQEKEKDTSQSSGGVEKSTSEVTSPTPIVIAPPLAMDSQPHSDTTTIYTRGQLGTSESNSGAVDKDNDHDLSQIGNLDGNGDMPNDSSEGVPMGGPGQVRMTSPVGTPLNIAPIPNIGAVDPNRQHPMSGMGSYSDSSRFPMGNPPNMMPGSGGNQMIPDLHGMMGTSRRPSMPGDMNPHVSQYQSGYMGSNQMQHPMNPMPAQMGNMMSPVDIAPQFPNPEMGLLEQLNILPSDNMMGPGGSYPAPPAQLPSSVTQIPLDNNQFGVPQMNLYPDSNNPSDMIDLNRMPVSDSSASSSGFGMNPSVSSTHMDINLAPGPMRSSAPSTTLPASCSNEASLGPSSTTVLAGQNQMIVPGTPTDTETAAVSDIDQQSCTESAAEPGTPTVNSDATGLTPPAPVRNAESASANSSPLTQMNQMSDTESVQGTSTTPRSSVPEQTGHFINSASSAALTIAPVVSTSQTTVIAPSVTNINSTTGLSSAASVRSAVPPVVVAPNTAATTTSASNTVVTTVTGTTPTVAPAQKAATNEAGKTINDLFKCMLCRVYFEDQQMYRGHVVHHGTSNQPIGTCRVCSRMFKTPLLFMNHLHCSAQCKGPTIPAAPVQQYTATTTRGRGRGRGSRGGATAPAVATPQTLYSHMQSPSSRGRGMGMQATAMPAQPMTMTMASPNRMVSQQQGSSPLQAMRQMAPTAGRRGRPPLNRQPTSYPPNAMRQPAQQHQFSAQLQQMGNMRANTNAPRQMTPAQRRRQVSNPADVIVID